MRLVIHENYQKISAWAAQYVADAITAFKPSQDNPFVLGLPTGSSPLGMYQNLIALYKKGMVSFEHVVTFNMDEYLGLVPSHSQSYHYFMHDNFFQYIDIKPENINLLDGTTNNPQEECDNYEQKIASYGGIRLFVGGIGVDGHIAFNEPGSSLCSRTRKKRLTADTREINSRFFDYDIEKTPEYALTVGVGTITDSYEVLILVNGIAKARALRQGIEGGISQMCTLSVLQMHKRAIIVCDELATYELKVGTVAYFKDIEKNNA